MLAESDIRQVVEFESSTQTVLSVYLNVDPHGRSADKYRLALRSLLDKATNAQAADIKRMQNFVEVGYNWQGRGLIMFSSVADDFWWAQSLSTPVEDAVFVSYRPYVRQLATLQDTYARYGVIHVEQLGARLYLFDMGHLEAVEGYLGEEVKVHKAGGWAAQRYQRHETGVARHNLQDAAELAEEFYRRADTRRLILAGTEKNLAQFRGMLSHRLRTMVVGEFPADTNANPTEIGAQAIKLVQQAADREANAVADAVVTTVHKAGNAVAGLAETLTAVQTGRAQHVVVLADFAQPAYRFVDSGYIVLDLAQTQELGSGKIQELPDAVESIIRRAMLQGIGVTILKEHSGLAELGSVAAQTRY